MHLRTREKGVLSYDMRGLESGCRAFGTRSLADVIIMLLCFMALRTVAVRSVKKARSVGVLTVLLAKAQVIH